VNVVGMNGFPARRTSVYALNVKALISIYLEKRKNENISFQTLQFKEEQEIA